MVIPFKQREAFINRERYDYRAYKDYDEDHLDRIYQSLPVKPPVYFKLTRLQRICFLIGAKTQRFCFFNDTGTGKSLLAISLIRYFRRLGLVKRALVLVPNRPNKIEWKDELEKHSPNSSYLILQGSSKEKWKALEDSNALFVFETYSGLYRMVCEKGERRGKTRLVFNEKLVRKLCSSFDGFVCDESVNVGNHSALPFRVCRQLSKKSNVVFTMTGTPFNRDPVLMWAQMYLVDHGYTLGETLGLFRSVFCNETINYFSGHTEYNFAKKKKAQLNEFIANASISFPADEGSLPKCVSVSKYISLGTDAQSYYNRFKEQLVASQGNFQETNNSFIRLRQISSGFIGYEDDETGERAKFAFPENPKLELLLSILKTIEEYKSIVFFDFNYSGEKIQEELKKAKIKSVLMYGKTKKVEDVKRQFIDDPKTKVFLLQNKMGAGLNIQVAKYGIFYENPVRAIERKQSQRRVERQHSLHKTVFIYDLIMRGGVDEQILQFHKEGGDLFEAIIRKG